jgi:RNA polymerase sigma-70 factor (ECF subfamily)
MIGETTFFRGLPTRELKANEVETVAPQSSDRPGVVSIDICSINLSQALEHSDEFLLKQIQEGGKEALALLFRRYAGSVRNVAYRILRNEAEADDLLQEVFIHIFHNAVLFDVTKGAARSWIFHVTYHRAFDRRRYLNSRHFYTSQELEEGSFCMTDHRKEAEFYQVSMEGVFGKELTDKLNARLSHEQFETIRLYFFEGHSLREIAEVTGRPLANVRNHYYRGLERLRKYVLPANLRSK